VADKSYGIHVAQMAGMPRTVTERAHEIMLELEKKSDFLLADGIYHKSEVKPRKKIIPGVKDQGDLFGLSEPD
ncbi:MAG: hypothetical protein J0L53_12915, partial [Spirochaetes bacterium]|nr:hypothetical protein [Spirochaetota bacterium]